MLIAFFDIDGVVHHEFVPPGQTVNGYSYVQVLWRLRDAVRRKWRNKWQGEWFLHHDNTSSHTSLVVQQFLAEKMGLKGTHFATMEDIKSKPSTGASNNGRIDGASVCVCARVLL